MSQANCIFCKIAAGDVPATKLHEDEHVVAFRDIHPQAPTHVLIVPKRHVPTLNDLGPGDDALVGHMVKTAAALAAQLGVAESGWRTVFNVNAAGGQTVFHIHLHLLGGRDLGWPPG